MPELPTVSVVIPVRDDTERLVRCLDALQRQDYPEHLVEVVVADDGSRVPVVDAAELPPRTRVRRVTAGGSYAARNAALEWSTGDVVAFTDSDCIPATDWLRQGVARLAGADVVAGRVELFSRDASRPTGAELYDMLHGFRQETYVRTLHFGVTANLITQRRVLDDVGGFDSTLRSGGDKDWGQRAHGRGHRIVYAPDVMVRHPARRSLRDVLAKLRRTVLYDPAPVAPPRPGVLAAALELAAGLRPPVMTIVRRARELPPGWLPLLRYATALTLVRTTAAVLRFQRLRHGPRLESDD